MNKIILKLQKILLIAVINLLIFNNSNADVIKKIFINGNERVSDETVIMFSKIKIGDEVSQKSLNDAVKELFSTNYFKDINFSIDDGNLTINLIENPIIQKTQINGIE